MIWVIQCGQRKQSTPAAAIDLYTGPYFRMCRRYAEAHRAAAVFILSARYGLVHSSEILPPYDLTLGQPGCVSLDTVREQAEAHGLLREPMTGLVTGRYLKMCAQLWPQGHYPLIGRGGIGSQMGWMKGQINALQTGKNLHL